MAEWFNAGRISPAPAGVWNTSSAYTRLDIVTDPDGQRSYIAKRDVPAGTLLTDETYWSALLDITEHVDAANQAADRANEAADRLEGTGGGSGGGGSGSGATPEQLAQIEQNRLDIADVKEDVITLENHILQSVAATGEYAAVNVYEGTQLNIVTHMMPVQSGSGDPSASNVRPITGRTTAELKQEGLNLIPYPYTRPDSYTNNGITYTVNDDNSITTNGTASAESFYLIAGSLYLEAGTYSMTGVPVEEAEASIPPIFYLRNSDKSYTNNITADGESFTIPKADNHGLSIDIVAGNTLTNAVFKPMLVRGDTLAEYEPYKTPITSSVDFGQTVYGGTIDWITKTLTVEWDIIESYAGESLPGEWISDRDVYAEGSTPTTGAQVVYRLAESITIDINVPDIETWNGTNVFSCDAGTTSVTGKKDLVDFTQYLLKQINALESAIITLGGNV